MRKQEFNSKLISLLPLDEVPVHVPLRRPRPLRFERLRVGGEGKADANLTNFLSTCCAWHPNSPARPGEASHPAPASRRSGIRMQRKPPSLKKRAPRRFGIRKSASHSGHSPLRGLGGGLGDASPARRGSRSRTASPHAPLAIRKAPSGRRRKNRRQSHKFFKHLLRLGTPTRRQALGRLPTPPPLPENLLSDCTKNCPLRPLRALRGFRNPKIGQQLGAQPTPRFRGRFGALFAAMLGPRSPFTFSCPPPIVHKAARA